MIIPASNICNLDQTSYRNENWQTIKDGHNDAKSIEDKRIETSPKVISHVNTGKSDSKQVTTGKSDSKQVNTGKSDSKQVNTGDHQLLTPPDRCITLVKKTIQ